MPSKPAMQGKNNPDSKIWAFPDQKFPEIAAATRREGDYFALYLGIGVHGQHYFDEWKNDTTNA